MEAKELAFKKEALEHGLAHIAIQNKDAMVELMLNIDETWRARSEKSWFEQMNTDGFDVISVGKPEGPTITNHAILFPTESPVDGIDNGWGAIGCRIPIGNKKGEVFLAPVDSITDHVVVKGASFDEKLPENWDNADLSDVPVDWMPEKGQSMFTVFDGKIYTSATPDFYVKGKKFPTLRLADMYLDSLKPVERWKPEVGDRYWYVTDMGFAKSTCWDGGSVDLEYFLFGNCFRTEQQAIAARERVKKALLG